jgi:uncharacterized membrane protein
MKQFFKYFIQGLLITVPIGITLWVIFKIFGWVSGMLARLDLLIDPFSPILAVIIIIALIFLVGFLGSYYLFTPLFSRIEKAIEKAPLIKIIYSSIKDFLSAFVGNKKRFNKPVLVLIDKANDIRQLGFITQSDLSDLNLGTDMVAVYMPMSYAFSGKLIIVPKQNVTAVDISAADAMKFIVSGGVTDIDDHPQHPR